MNTKLSVNHPWLTVLGLSYAAACATLAPLTACDGGSVDAISSPPATDAGPHADAGADAPSVLPAFDAGPDAPTHGDDASQDSGSDAPSDAPVTLPPPDGTVFRGEKGLTITGMTSDGYLVYSDPGSIRYSKLTDPPWDGVASKLGLKQTAIVRSILFIWDSNSVLTLVQGGKVFARNVSSPAADLTMPAVSPDDSTVAWMETSFDGTTEKSLVVSTLAQGDRSITTALSRVGCVERFEFGSNNALFVGHCTATAANQGVTLTMLSPSAAPKDLYPTVEPGSWGEDPTGAWAWADTNPLNSTVDAGNRDLQVVRAADGQTATLPAASQVFDSSGNWLYYSDNAHAGLYRMARSTLASTLVTSSACTAGGVFRLSPDGHFALCSNPSSSTTSTPATRDLVSTDTGAVTHLGSGTCLFTPDSAYVWCNAGHDITVFSTATGVTTAHATGTVGGVYTADHKYLVTTSSGGYSAIALDGSSAPTPVAVNDPQHVTLLALTGSSVLLQDGPEIRVVDAAGKAPTKVLTKLLSLDGGWALSPDKTQVAYVPQASAEGIYLLSTQ